MVTMLESFISESTLTFSAPKYESRSIYLHRLWTDLVKTLLIQTQCEFKAILYYNLLGNGQSNWQVETICHSHYKM